MGEKYLQVIRLAGMILAIAGILYAVEYLPLQGMTWVWIGVLGVGFVGLLFTFRLSARKRRQTQPQKRNKTSRR